MAVWSSGSANAISEADSCSNLVFFLILFHFDTFIFNNDFLSFYTMTLCKTSHIGFEAPNNFIDGRPKAALLFWLFGDFRCGALLFMVILVIYKYKNR